MVIQRVVVRTRLLGNDHLAETDEEHESADAETNLSYHDAGEEPFGKVKR